MEKDIEFFRQEYKKQKKLEVIVNSRVLKKPKIKKWQVAINFAILSFLFIQILVFSLLIDVKLIYKIVIFASLLILIIEIDLRFCLILLVKYYQAVAKEETRRRCKCIPSCSEYALISLSKIFPLIIALKKIKKRLYVTCDGEDYKIDFPTKKMEKNFENSL